MFSRPISGRELCWKAFKDGTSQDELLLEQSAQLDGKDMSFDVWQLLPDPAALFLGPDDV